MDDTKYPGALMFSDDDRMRGQRGGGNVFLKRVLKVALEKGGPVVISTGDNYLRYEYKAGHKTFKDGIVEELEVNDRDKLERFNRSASEYQVEIGLKELGYSIEGKKKLFPSLFGKNR